MSDKRYHISIIGGGITGLSAAFFLQREIREKGLPIDFTLIESSDRLGGRILTYRHDGFVMEGGPDSFLEGKVSATKLAHDLGLAHELVNNETGTSYIYHKDRLLPIPEGAVLGIPTRLLPFARTPLFSPLAKLRAAADLILPAGRREEDESVGSFFRRRLGDEVVENLIEPLLSGVYAGDIDRLSLRSTFPQVAGMEQKYRSLIVGMKRARKPVSAKSKGIFQTLTSGLQTLVERMEDHLPGSAVLKGTKPTRLEKGIEGYRLHLNTGEVIHTQAIILASPHSENQRLLAPFLHAEPLPRALPTSVATISMAFPEQAIRHSLEGTGFVIPRHAGFAMTACTWTHKKWPHTAPAGKAHLRCYVGRPGNDVLSGQTDEEIVWNAYQELRRILPISGYPDFYHVTRHYEAMPQYVTGHRQWLADLSNVLQSSLPGIWLAGASYEGIGLPDCIDQGKRSVGKAIQMYMESRCLVASSRK